MRAPIIAASVAGVFLTVGSFDVPNAQTLPPNFVTLRALQAPTTQIQRILDEIGQDVPREVPPKVSPYVVFRSFCGGSITNDYLEQVKQRNPDFQFSPSPTVRTVVLPVCAKVAKLVTVEVLPGDTLESIVGRYLGVKPDDIIASCRSSQSKNVATGKSPCKSTARDAIAALNGGNKAGLDDLVPGRQLLLPVTTRSTTFALRDGVSPDVAIQKIQNAQVADNAKVLTNVQESPDLRLLTPLKSNDEKVKGTSCSPESAALTRPWPFDSVRLRTLIEANKVRARQRNISLIPTVIRIADTGAVGLESYFPKEALAINKFEKPFQPYDLDGNHFNGDYYGFDAAQNGDVRAYDDDPNRLHGTAVADLALGGLAFRTLYPDIYSLLHIEFSKIYWKRGGPLTVNDSSLSVAMSNVTHHEMPTVINFSVGGGDQGNTRDFVTDVLAARVLHFLVVIAAGNASDDIGDKPMYPAAYGGTGSEAADYIISVGASNPDSKLAAFSNFSSDRVDLLAPGCRIEFTDPSGETSILHGTSMAAPLVSFTAGLVHALGIADVIAIKERLIATADFDPFASSSRYGAILNVERAAAVFQDTLETQHSEAFWGGTWRLDDGYADICADKGPFLKRRLLRIDSYLAEGGEPQLRVLSVGVDGRMNKPIYCPPTDNEVQFDDDDGHSLTIPWREMRSLVPAYPFPSSGSQ